MTVRRHPKSPYWHFDLHYRGRRYKGSTKQTSKLRAEEHERRLRYQLETGHDPFFRSPLLKELLPQYLSWLETNRSAKHLRRSRGAIENVLGRMRGVKTAEDITPSRIESYKKRRLHEERRLKDGRLRKVSPNTVNLELRHFKAFLKRSVKQGWLQSMPVEIEQVKTPGRGRLIFLAEDEIAPFLDRLKDWAREAAWLFLLTGLRLEEGRFLEWRDIDLEAAELWVRNKPELGFSPKNGKERVVPIPPELLDELRARGPGRGWVLRGAKGGQLDGKVFRLALLAAAKAAGLDERITPHTLRHSYGSHLVMSGVDVQTIKELLGHSSILTTAIYMHTDAEHRRRAVAKLRMPGMGKSTERVIQFPSRGESGKLT